MMSAEGLSHVQGEDSRFGKILVPASRPRTPVQAVEDVVNVYAFFLRLDTIHR